MFNSLHKSNLNLQGGDAHPVEPDWVGLRLGKIADWRQQFLGPLAELPDVIRGFFQQLIV